MSHQDHFTLAASAPRKARHRRPVSLISWIALAAVPASLSAAACPVVVDLSTGLVLVALVSLLTAGALGLVAAARSHSQLAGWAAATVLALAYAWHWRERVWPPEGRSESFLFAAAVLAVVACVSSSLARRPFRPQHLLLPLAALALSLVLLIALFKYDDYSRWVLLRHVRSIGTPLHLLFGRSPTQVFETSWLERVPVTSAQAAVARERWESADSRSADVVVVLVDTLRADALWPYGGSPGDLPEFDRLARESLVFMDVRSNSSWTRPSVASLFTGLQPDAHGARDRKEALDHSVTTVSELFGASGYETAAFVANVAVMSRSSGFEQGFSTYQELGGTPYARAGVVVDAVARWLDARSSNRPYFCYVHFLDPHTPYLSGGLSTSRRPQALLPAYRAELRYLDRELGRLRALLSRKRTRPLSLLLLSDHGEEFGDHGGDDHGRTLYREMLHVPALLHSTGVPGGRVESSLELRDFFDLLSQLSTRGADAASWANSRARSIRYASLNRTGVPATIVRPYLRDSIVRRVETDSHVAIWSAYGDTIEIYDKSADQLERRNLRDESPHENDAIVRQLQQARPPWSPGVSFEVDEEALEQLRALGYAN